MMQFIVEQRTLLKELIFLQGAVEKKNSVPVLNQMLIETDGNRLRLQATDLELSLTTACDAAIAGNLSLCIPAKKLLEIVKSLPTAKIICKVEADSVLHLTCDRARFKLKGMTRESFPAIPAAPSFIAHLPAAQMRQFIARTLFAVTEQKSRYSLNGVKLELTNHHLRMVATDGHRLSLVEASGEFGEGLTIDTMIPKKALHELTRMAQESEGEIGFAVTENHIFFQAGQRQLAACRLAQNFPDYDLVLPKVSPHHLEVNTHEMAAALRRVALMADERTHGVSLNIKAGQLMLSAQASGAGEAGEVVAAAYEGEEITAACNVSFLQDFFSVVGSERVRLECKDGDSQFCLSPSAANGLRFTYVVMPLRP